MQAVGVAMPRGCKEARRHPASQHHHRCKAHLGGDVERLHMVVAALDGHLRRQGPRGTGPRQHRGPGERAYTGHGGREAG